MARGAGYPLSRPGGSRGAMEILSYVDEDVVCLRFVGDFDTMDVPAFEAHVAEAVETQSLRLVINSAEMRLINSSASRMSSVLPPDEPTTWCPA